MKRPQRKFSSSFCDHMLLNSAWPDYRSLEDLFFNLRGKGAYSATSYSAAKKGRPAPETFTNTFALALLHLATTSPSNYSGRQFARYLATRRVSVTTGTPFKDILNNIYDESDGGPNPFHLGIAGIGEAIGIYDRVRDVVRECSVARGEVDHAIEWMVTTVGRQIGGEKLSIEEAKRVASERMCCTAAEYAAQARRWCGFNPWTVIQTKGFSSAGGVSVVLPIQASTRELIIGGHMRSYDCGEEHLCCPSPILLLEACAERPSDLGGEPHRAKKQLFLALLAQCSMLARLSHQAPEEPLRILSFGGTPENRCILEAFGFRPVGAKMRDTGVEFLERLFPSGALDGPGATLRFFMSQIGKNIDHPPFPLDERKRG